MNVTKAVLFLALATLPALPANADVKIDSKKGVDFTSYRTYAWKAGTDAIRPDVQAWIVDAVERELEAAGLTKASEGEADLHVKTHASSTIDGQVRGGFVSIGYGGGGVITSDIVTATRGILLVELLDPESDKPLWQAMATEVMGMTNPKKVHRKIDKVTGKMFKNFPPR